MALSVKSYDLDCMISWNVERESRYCLSCFSAIPLRYRASVDILPEIAFTYPECSFFDKCILGEIKDKPFVLVNSPIIIPLGKERFRKCELLRRMVDLPL